MTKILAICSLLLASCLGFSQDPPRSFTVKYISEEIRIDGAMDEAIWEQADGPRDFQQYFPTDSVLAKHQTNIKMLVSETTLYIGIVQYAPGNDYTIPSLERDYRAGNSDNISILFDTFNDGQNAFLFGINPMGVRREALIAGGGVSFDNFITAWDVKWRAETQIHDKYYVAELAIPLTSFKFSEGETKWRFQSYRFEFQSNERSTWPRIPQNQNVTNLGFMGDMNFERPLGKSRTPIALIPYVNGIALNDYEGDGSDTNFQVGGDAKISIGNSMNLDVTINPDFSNVEVDDIFTNLTRFEIGLPERRQFFIDNGDLFGNFGDGRDANPFFSRRIGIAKDTADNSIENKIIGGVRLSGKIDENWRLGLFSIQTDEDIVNEIPSNNNSMFVLQRKMFARSNVGFFFINRQTFGDYEFLEPEDEYNRVVGIDYNLNTADNRWVGRFYAHKSFQPGDKKGNYSASANLAWNSRYWNFQSDIVFVDEDFRSDLGFIRRTDILKPTVRAERVFWPSSNVINNHRFGIFANSIFRPTLDYQKTDRFVRAGWEVQFQNQSQLEVEYFNQFIFLTEPFDPTDTEGGVPLPGNQGYDFNRGGVEYQSNRAQTFSYSFDTSYGGFFNGTRFSFGGQAVLLIQPKVQLRLVMNYDGLRLPDPYPDADLWLLSPGFDITFSKSIFWSTLVQYSNQRDNLGINSRLQWRFAPLSDLFLVYNDNYFVDGFAPRFRSINLKISYWLNI
ncbi:MAG: DUF5916 domain-containing protein [Flavobacteriaceae bacterium]